MTQSKSYYDELGGRLRGLVISLDNVLSSEEATDVEEFIEHAEFGEALRTLAWIIVEANKQIRISDLTEIEALASLMEIAEEMPDDLHGHVGAWNSAKGLGEANLRGHARPAPRRPPC